MLLGGGKPFYPPTVGNVLSVKLATLASAFSDDEVDEGVPECQDVGVS